MIIADASVVVNAVLGHPVGARLAKEEAHAPGHVDAEIGQTVRRLVHSGRWDDVAGSSALIESAHLIDVRHEIPGELAAIAWAMRDRVSFYDALYVALAAVLDVPLLTADGRLARAGLPCRVELVA